MGGPLDPIIFTGLEDVFDQLVDRRATKGTWPVDAGRIVSNSGALDSIVDPVRRYFANIDVLVVIG